MRSGIFPKNLALRGRATSFANEVGNDRVLLFVVTKSDVMTKLLYIGGQMGAWWSVAKFLLAVILVTFLISQGLHPAWGIVLFIYRKAALRICLLLGLLYWLTHGII